MLYSEKSISLSIIKVSCVLGALICMMFGALNIFYKNRILTGIIDTGFAIYLIILFYFIQKKHISVGLANKIFVVVGMVFLSYMMFDGGYNNTAILWAFLVPIFCFFLKDERIGLMYFLFFMFIISIIYLTKILLKMPLPFSKNLLAVLYVALFFEGIFMYSYKLHRKEMQNHVKSNMSAMLEKTSELSSDNKILKQLTTYDTLTHIYNRRGILEILKAEMQRKQRFGDHFSLIIADLDDFKKMNDTYGHLFGDYVLTQFSDILVRDILRKIDSIGRFGGEEFMIILPSTDKAGAEIVAARINRMISSALFKDEKTGKSSSLTVSLGICTSEYGNIMEDIIHNADMALYRAKANGKNGFVTFSESLTQIV